MSSSLSLNQRILNLTLFVVISSLSPLNDKASYLVIPNQLFSVRHLWTDRYPDLTFQSGRDSSRYYVQFISSEHWTLFLAIPNLLCPHYLWTDRFLDLPSLIPSGFFYVRLILLCFYPLNNFDREFIVFWSPYQPITDLQKFWRRFYWHSKKTNSQTILQSVWTIYNLSTFTKDES